MKKLPLKRILCCLLAVVLLCACIRGLSSLMSNKSSASHFSMFYEEEQNFDILFFGSSHMKNAAIPMQLWHEHGITSYNMSFGSCRMANSYWLLKNAFEHTNPQLVVMDCAYIYEEEKTSDASRPNHMLFSTMPLGLTKLEAIWDLYDNRSDRMRYLFPLTEFHRRWNELSANDFFPSKELMGQDLYFTAEKATINCAPRDDSATVDTVCSEYLDQIILECRNRGIEILLVYIPFQANEKSMNDMAAMYSIAENRGVNYIDPYTMLEFLDPATDYANSYDDNSHLNYFGASKFTEYIGRYVRENYELPDHRDEEAFAHWHQYYQQHLSVIEDALAKDA